MSISKFGTTSKSNSSPKVIGVEKKVSKSGDTMYGDLNLNHHSIKNLASPEEEYDSVNKQYVDSALNKRIRFVGTPHLGLKLAILTFDSHQHPLITHSSIKIRENDIVGVHSIFGNPLRIESDNASIELDDELFLSGVANPSNPTDAANKYYVDEKTQFFQPELNNIAVLRNLDLKNNSIINIGNPVSNTSPITRRWFNRNAYKPRFQFFLGRLNTLSVVKNTPQIINIMQQQAVGNNFLCRVNENRICFSDEVENNSIEIFISGSVTGTPSDTDRLEIFLTRNRENNEQVISKTSLIREFNCVNMFCLDMPEVSDTYQLKYNYISSLINHSTLEIDVKIKISLNGKK